MMKIFSDIFEFCHLVFTAKYSSQLKHVVCTLFWLKPVLLIESHCPKILRSICQQWNSAITTTSLSMAFLKTSLVQHIYQLSCQVRPYFGCEQWWPQKRSFTVFYPMIRKMCQRVKNLHRFEDVSALYHAQYLSKYISANIYFCIYDFSMNVCMYNMYV